MGTASLDNLPGQLIYSFRPGETPAPQVFQVRSTGPAALSWTLTKSTSDGGAWLNVSAASGTTPQTLTVSIAKTNLPGAGAVNGAYLGQIAVTAGGNTATIPIVVRVGSDVFRQINPLFFTKTIAGADPVPQVLTIATISEPFQYSVVVRNARGGNWLKFEGCNLGCAAGKALTVKVAADLTLPSGTYTGQILLTSFHQDQIISIPVTLTVGAAGQAILGDSPGQLSFAIHPGGSPPTQEMRVQRGGGGALAWSLTTTTSDGGNWLNPSITSGSTPALIEASVTPAALPDGGLLEGRYTGQIVVESATGRVTIPVSVTVSDSFFNQSGALYFSMQAGGAKPLPQVLTIGGPGIATTHGITWYTSRGGNWLTVSGCDSFCPNPSNYRVGVNPSASLEPGTYTGEVVVELFTEQAMVIPVYLTVYGVADVSFDDMPGQLSFALATGGNAPPAQEIEVRRFGGGTMTWTLTAVTSDGGGWLVTSSASGSTPSTVTVSITTSALPNFGLVAGTFSGELRFLSSQGQRVTVPVSVAVGASVFRQVNPLYFVKPEGGTVPLPQLISAVSTGNPINYGVEFSAANGGNWLTFVGCNSFCTTPGTVRVAVTPPANMAAGRYTGQIVIKSTDGKLSMLAPVTLTVASQTGPYFDSVQGQLPFSAVPGGTGPAPLTAELRNAGTGTLAWTAETVTADGGNWLSLSATSGNITAGTPFTLTASVNTAELPNSGLVAGTFLGRVLLKSAAGDISFPVTTYLRPNSFAQVAPVELAMASGGSVPGAQNVVLANNGSPLNYNMFRYVGSGGLWLDAVGCESFCTPPQTVAVGVKAGVNPPTGTYTGEIIATTNGSGEASTVVPVILRVTGAPCTYSISPGSASVPVSGTATPGVVQVTASGPACPWTASVNDPSFIVRIGAGSGTGSGEVLYSVFPNSGSAPRSGTMTIAGQTFTINQQGPCDYSISPTTASAGAAGGTGAVAVTTTNGCPWTATSNAAWITVTSGASGSGNGSVGYTVAANVGVQRVGTLTVAGKTFTVTQAAGCSYTLGATSANATSAGGAGSVGVSAAGGCGWTASSNAAWLTITSGASGSGNGTVNYTAAQNLGAQRVGTLTIAGQTFTVTQAAPPPPASFPSVGAMTPASGNTAAGTFSFTFSDPDGAADLNVINLLVNDFIDGRNACYIAFVRSSGQLFLVNDAGDAGGPFAGGITIPGSGSVSNSQCTINAAGSSVTQSGNTLTLNLAMSFTGGFGGNRIFYLAARDMAEHNTGWHAKGVWNVPGKVLSSPGVVSLAPSRTNSNAATLTATFFDSDGAADLNVINILINDFIDGRNACYLAFVRSSGQVLLVNDTGDAGGPFAGSATIPGTGSVNNSQCTINAAGSSVTQVGNQLILTLSMSFSGGFAGDRIVYMAARDVAEHNSGWQAMGTVTVPSP
ncbi:MAG: BACON domain-containing carbohydrate-binding protein [Bryobacteraceae bacterium]